MKTSFDRWLLIVWTVASLSTNSSNVSLWSLLCQIFTATTTVSNSSWLMWRRCCKISSGNLQWKNSPSQTAPQPVRQASVGKSRGLETTMSVGITETPMKWCRKNIHHWRSDRTSSGILIRDLQFSGACLKVLISRHIKTRPGRTHEVTKADLRRSCCNSFLAQDVLDDQDESSSILLFVKSKLRDG